MLTGDVNDAAILATIAKHLILILVCVLRFLGVLIKLGVVVVRNVIAVQIQSAFRIFKDLKDSTRLESDGVVWYPKEREKFARETSVQC